MLILLIQDRPKFYWIEGQVPSHFVLEGKVFFERASTEDTPVFYDWIHGEGKTIAGIEIHLPSDDPLLRSRLSFASLPYISQAPYPAIWFLSTQGRPAGLEAFGDIRFFGDESGDLAVVVGTDWLEEEQVFQLKKRCTPFE